MHLLLVFLITCCCALLPAADKAPGVVTLRPALALVLGLEPGGGFSFKEHAQSGFLIDNGRQTDSAVQVEAIAPVRHPWQYELGYEPPPDGTWFTADPGTFVLPGGQRGIVDLRASIPNDPAYANRHWMVYLECGPPTDMALGAVLKLRARVLIETMPAPPQEMQLPSGNAHLAPSVIYMQQQPDGSWVGETSIGHSADQAVTYDLLRIPQLWGDDLSKAHRYFQQPAKAVLSDEWAQAANDQRQWVVEPGIWHPIRFTAEQVGEIEDFREEIVFLARRTLTPDFTPEPDVKLPKAEARAMGSIESKERLTNPNVQILGVLYDHVELLRLRYVKADEEETDKETP